jgi:hypothetical protein
MKRHQFLRRLHAALRPRNYLEIGVSDGRSLTLSRVPTIAIDPAFNITTPLQCDLHLVKATSDDFFARKDPIRHLRGGRNPWRNARRGRPLLAGWRGKPVIDLAFIDGMHLFEFALRDFINVEQFTDWKSVVVLDDMLPRNVDEAARERHTSDWTGDVFRVGEILRARRPDLVTIAVDTAPTGVLVILGPDRSDTMLRDSFDDIVQAELRPDPQAIPEHILNRDGAVDPTALLAEPLWRELARSRGKARRRDRTLSDIRRRVDTLGGDATGIETGGRYQGRE